MKKQKNYENPLLCFSFIHHLHYHLMMCYVTHQGASFLSWFVFISFHFLFSFSMYFRFISSRPVHHRRSSINCLSSPHQTSSTSCPSISTQRALLETTTGELHLCGHAPAVSGTGSLDVVFWNSEICIPIHHNSHSICLNMQELLHTKSQSSTPKVWRWMLML